ncbi:MAG: ABC transporter permease [Vicinamibacterales bacterium]
MVIDGLPQELRGLRVTPSLFRVLRVSPALGRSFTDREGDPGGGSPIVLSHGLWQSMFGGDPAALGRTIRLGWTGEPYTVVGVMPAGFRFFDAGPDGHASGTRGNQFWIPLVLTPEQKADSARTRYGFFHVGRLKPGATLAALQAELDALRERNGERFPQFRYDELGMLAGDTAQDALTRGVRRTLCCSGRAPPSSC